ncbi:hypothetical protein [Lactobacillus juensis]|uniref:hypothetical protein n=1 Tax=Lactobacillus juensis TaxID=3082862 RepID=UPI0030C6D826
MEEYTNLNLNADITGMLDIVISDLKEIKSDIKTGRHEEDIPLLLKRSQVLLNSLNIKNDDED